MNGHRASERRLTQLQAASGLLFALFVFVHLANTTAALGDAESYNSFQRSARQLYQNPVLEVTLVGLPLLVHLSAAIVRIRRRGLTSRGGDLRARLHRYTGYYLLLVIVGHLVAVRGTSLAFGVFPEFEGVSFSLWWQPWLFYPYYVLLSTCALYHGTNGVLVALRAFGVPVPIAFQRGWGFWLPTGVASVALFLAVLALGGLLYDVPDPTSNDYARLWERYFGVELAD